MSAVLIVDDDARIRDVLARWLALGGYQTKEAADAEAAVERLAGGGCGVVLCDVMMPGRGGLWLVEHARVHHPAVAMVLATGLENVPPSSSLAENVVDYLIKPFERVAVLTAVDRARAWHETAALKRDAGDVDDALASWLRGGRTQSPEIK
jgi:DNA-binding NtrC family response regulator